MPGVLTEDVTSKPEQVGNHWSELDVQHLWFGLTVKISPSIVQLTNMKMSL